MTQPISIQDALRSPQAQASQGPEPITFDEAVAERSANTRNVVQVDRLQRAQALRDMGLVDPRETGNPDVPIENFLRTETPPVQPARKANFLPTLKAAIPKDMSTRRRMLAQSLFPDDPQGINRVGFLDGVPVFVDEGGQLRRVSGPWATRGAEMAANLPEIAGSVVGSFATGNPITGSALGTAGGAGVKRSLSALLTAEPVTTGSVTSEMASEGATDVVGGLIGKGVASFADRGRVADFTPLNYRAAEATRNRLKQSTGVNLDLAQASGNSKLIAIRAYAARYPGKSAELIQAADEIAQGQFETGVNRVLDSIARASPAEVYGMRGLNAARLVIEAAKAQRNQTVAPFYEAARKVTLSHDVVDQLNKDPVLRWASTRVRSNPIFERDLKDASRDSIGFWHYVQQELDDQISKSAKEPNKVRILTQARRDLNQKLEAASPEFAQANAYYAKVTRESIEPLESSAVGVLARISNPKSATAAARIFSDPNISAAELRATRASIAKQDPEAWNGLVRQWIASRWNRALKETQAGSAVNPAGKLRQALLGTPQDKAKMNVMLPPGAVQAFDDLMEAAQSLARTPTAGSNTMRDTEIKDQLKGTALTVFRYITSPRQSIREAGEQRALERGTEAIAEAILNPQKRAQLRQVVRMAPGTRKAILLSAILSAKSISKGTDAPTELPDASGRR